MFFRPRMISVYTAARALKIVYW